MKKFLLLMMALLTLGASGAWADSYYFATAPTQVTSITSGNYYVIDGRDQVNDNNKHYLFDNGTKVTSNNPQALPTDWNAGKFIWKIVGNSSDGYTLQNVQTGKFMSLGSSNGSQISSSDTPQTNGIYFNASDYATILNSNGQAIDIGNQGNNPTTWSGTTTADGSRRLAIYEVEVVEIEDDACYTIDFVSKDQTKTWGLRSGTTEASPNANNTGDVYVAHSYTNSSGNKRWIFVNNSDGTYLAYHGQANAAFNISNAINEWNITSLTAGSGSVNSDANCAGKVCITNDKRYTNNSSGGCYIVKESNGAYDNSSAPFYNGTFTSALTFTATGDAVSSTAALAIAKFEALNEVKDYLAYAGNISALFADPSSIEANINAAATAEAAATIATNYMKSPEGKKFYAVNSNATGQYLNVGESYVTATSTKLYAEAVMEVEYAGAGRYYLKGIKNSTYACAPGASANISTTSTKGSAETFYIVNRNNDIDNKVYFSNKKTSGNYGAIHYNVGYTYKCVGYTYDAEASQWSITFISDKDYEALLNVCDVTYHVVLEASGTYKDSNEDPIAEVIGSAISLPSDLTRDYCTYTYYSDAACTSPLTTVPDAASTTIYALAEVNTPFTVSANYATATWYNMKLFNVTYPLYTSGADPNVSLPTEPGKEANMEWAFIGNPYDGYQIINKGAGDGLVLGSETDDAGSNGSGSYATMATSGTQTYERWFPRVSTHYTNGFYLYNSNDHALNKRSNDNLAYWTGGADQGSTFTISSVTDNAAELTEIANRLDDYTYGSAYGEYSLTGDYSGYESLMAGSIIPGLKSYSYLNLLNARAIEAAKSLNVPQAGDFLRIKASATNKSAYSVSDDIYLTSSNTQSEVNNSAYKDKRVGFVLGTANDNTTIFYYDGDSHLTGLADGLQPITFHDGNGYQMKIGAVDASATIVTFESIEATENKAFRIEFNNGGRSLYTQRYSGVYFTDAAGGNATDSHYRYFLEKVTSLPVTISSAEIATLYAPVDLTIPDGVTAYYGSVVHGEWMTLNEIDGTIPAGTGVVLMANAGTYNFDITSGASSIVGNLLTGTTAAMTWTNEYTLQLENGTNEPGFFGNAPTDNVIPGFKAYLPSANAAGVKGFKFSLATAVKALQQAKKNGTVYDLNGRRVVKPAKGLYIIDGQKVMIK